MRVYHRDTMASRPIRFFHRGAVVEVDGVAADAHRARLAARGRALHRHQGRLRRRRLRRLHRRRRRARRRRRRQGASAAAACAASTPASSSCRRSTARRCSRSRTCSAADGALHPVQQAMVDCHGSQCGFCTPGFVMSLWATYQHHQARAARGRRASRSPTSCPATCAAAPATGRSSMPAQRMFDLPAVPLDAAPVVAALRSAARRRAAARVAAPAPTLPSRRARSPNFAALRAAHPERAHPRRLDRRRPVGQQAVPRPAATSSTSATSTS